MHVTKKITAGLDAKLYKSASLYHCIICCINLQQVKNEPNDNFKLRWDNVCENIELAGGLNIIRINQLVKVIRYQASSKEKQVQVDEMKSIFFLLITDQKR